MNPDRAAARGEIARCDSPTRNGGFPGGPLLDCEKSAEVRRDVIRPPRNGLRDYLPIAADWHVIPTEERCDERRGMLLLATDNRPLAAVFRRRPDRMLPARTFLQCK